MSIMACFMQTVNGYFWVTGQLAQSGCLRFVQMRPGDACQLVMLYKYALGILVNMAIDRSYRLAFVTKMMICNLVTSW